MTFIRGVQLFAPYQGRSGWTARPPSPGQPARPLLRDDPDDIWQVAAAFPTPLLNGQEPKPGRFPDRVLDHPAAHPGSGCDLINAPITQTVLANFVADNAQHRQLTDRELAGQRRRHGTGGREVPTPGNRNRTLRSPLQSLGREDRGAARWN